MLSKGYVQVVWEPLYGRKLLGGKQPYTNTRRWNILIPTTPQFEIDDQRLITQFAVNNNIRDANDVAEEFASLTNQIYFDKSLYLVKGNNDSMSITLINSHPVDVFSYMKRFNVPENAIRTLDNSVTYRSGAKMREMKEQWPELEPIIRASQPHLWDDSNVSWFIDPNNNRRAYLIQKSYTGEKVKLP